MKKIFLMGRSEAGKTSLTQALKGEGAALSQKPSIQTQMKIRSIPRVNTQSPNISALDLPVSLLKQT